jgi:hypothetical protein
LTEAILLHPKKSFESLQGVKDSQIIEALKFLRTDPEYKEFNIKIIMIGHVEDGIFPPREIAKNVSRKMDLFDGVVEIDGPHSGFIINPQKPAELIVDMLANLKKIKQKHGN